MVLNSLLTANGLPTFKMGKVTPPKSFPPTSTDTSSFNTQSIFTPSWPDKPSTATSENHLTSIKLQLYQEKTNKKTKKNISELLSGNKLILKPPLKIDEVIEHLTSNKNNIEVVNLSSTDFDQIIALRQRHQI